MIQKILRYIMAIPNTIYINLKVFDFKTAIKFPVICSKNVQINKISKGSIVLNDRIRFGMVKLGMSDGSYSRGKGEKSILNISNGGKIVLEENIIISNNFVINVNANATITMGKNFWCNYGLILSCSKHIRFGTDVLIGWNCCFIDGDGHEIIDKNEPSRRLNKDKDINIGNHVWFASNTTCLKGSSISNDCVIAQGCIVSKNISTSNCIIAGIPARVLKNNIDWKK